MAPTLAVLGLLLLTRMKVIYVNATPNAMFYRSHVREKKFMKIQARNEQENLGSTNHELNEIKGLFVQT